MISAEGVAMKDLPHLARCRFKFKFVDDQWRYGLIVHAPFEFVGPTEQAVYILNNYSDMQGRKAPLSYQFGFINSWCIGKYGDKAYKSERERIEKLEFDPLPLNLPKNKKILSMTRTAALLSETGSESAEVWVALRDVVENL